MSDWNEIPDLGQLVRPACELRGALEGGRRSGGEDAGGLRQSQEADGRADARRRIQHPGHAAGRVLRVSRCVEVDLRFPLLRIRAFR